MQVGKWLEQQGIDVKPSARPTAGLALPPMPAHRATEKLLAAVYAPWNDMENNRHKPVKVLSMHCCQCKPLHTLAWQDNNFLRVLLDLGSLCILSRCRCHTCNQPDASELKSEVNAEVGCTAGLFMK